MLLDVGALGFDSGTASDRLLARGRSRRPDAHWGQVTATAFVRLVFSNEPTSRWTAWTAASGRRSALKPDDPRSHFPPVSSTTRKR